MVPSFANWQSRDSNYNLAVSGPPPSGGCSTLIGQVSGIQVCLDADAGVSGSTWTDQTSNAYSFTTNSINTNTCNAPTWGAASYGGKAGWTFVAASSQCLATTAAAVSGGWTNMSWFIAMNVSTNSQSFARMLNFTANGQTSDNNSTSFIGFLNQGGASTLSCFFNGSFICTAYSITNGAGHRYGTVVASTPSENTYLDNVLQHTDANAGPTLAATGQIGIGQGGAQYFDGVIRRIVITNTAVSSTDRSNIDTFLTN